MKVRTATLERVFRSLGIYLHVPLSIDDALYAQYCIQQEIFNRRVEEWKKQLFEEWNERYTIRFHDGYYERGQLVRKCGMR